MAAKTNRNKKTSAAPAPRAAAKRPANTKPKQAAPASRPSAVYVSVSRVSVSLSGEKPKGNHAGGPCAGFEAARQAAIDAIVAAIEDGERQLHACKRATSLEELRRL